MTEVKKVNESNIFWRFQIDLLDVFPVANTNGSGDLTRSGVAGLMFSRLWPLLTGRRQAPDSRVYDISGVRRDVRRAQIRV